MAAGMVDGGSSPPVRGALIVVMVVIRRSGLIPARAGSTVKTAEELLKIRAHPRPCGEHQEPQSVDDTVSGSSPPVRGAR